MGNIFVNFYFWLKSGKIGGVFAETQRRLTVNLQPFPHNVDTYEF